jgi:two-component system phosphate regulon sensor histidine kinase PhoR
LKSNHIRIAVILGTISIAGIIAFQLYWVNKSYDLAEQQFTQSVEIALYNVADNVLAFNGKELPNENPVRQISSNYFIVDINDIIDANILDHYLKTEFEFQNLRIDYEYAIYDCETDKMVFGNYITSDTLKGKQRKQFQKYDEFTYYFGIIFPSKALYILNSMNIWIISSFVLFTAMVFFAYAIFIILRQKRLWEIQRDFINNMTHEFKTPVSTIKIAANVLSDPEMIEDKSRILNYSQIIQKQNNRIEQHIEKVLQLARVEKNKYNFHKEEVDLHEVINEVIKSFDLVMKDLHGKLKLNLEAESSKITADMAHLSNAIYNLIDNAIKYSTDKPSIDVETRTKGNKIHLMINDNGIGIDKKYHRKIFTRFYRIPSGNIHNVKGFGIGLSYVKNILNAHGWKIEIKSTPGTGSSFQIIIPINE